jgi:hypothetical protein
MDSFAALQVNETTSGRPMRQELGSVAKGKR